MLISFINQKSFPNILVTMLRPDEAVQNSEQKGSVVRISNKDNQTLGYNFLNLIDYLELDAQKDGQIYLNKDQVDKLNQQLVNDGFEADLTADDQPKIVYGKVVELEAHPDSDHLSITKVDVGTGELLQIVCGAPNVAQGQTVVAALSGAVMPDGKIIWPGQLRGVDSAGMLTSAKEMSLSNAPKERGIMVLPETDFHIGEAFDPETVNNFLAKEA